MTNGWIDIKNTDMMLIEGGNPAENHPCGFKWAIEAKRNRNAKMIVVDPRFTRTAAVADLYLQIRTGTDIAFLGGLIRYAIENNRIAKDYLVNFTNAAFIIKDGFKLPEDGLYSGFDAATQTYDKSTWNYAEGGDVSGSADAASAPVPHGQDGHGRRRRHRPVPSRPRLRCCRKTWPTISRFSIRDASSNFSASSIRATRRRWWRRSPAFRRDQFLKAADLFTSIRKDGDMKKVATIIYAVGWTQHTSGTQTIRDRRHAATAARQCRARRRRRERAARALQHSRRHRHGRSLRSAARLSEGAESHTTQTWTPI